MTNRGKRLHAITDALNEGLTTAERLAASTDVTVRTIYRDMQMLKGIGLPIVGEAGVGYVLRPNKQVRGSRHG